MNIPFCKMHGLGNDFVVLDSTRGKAYTKLLTTKKIQQLADRHFGIGFDQLLVIQDAKESTNDFSYRIFNSDGSEVEMCGNGIRCFAKYVVEKGLTTKQKLKVETLAGVIEPEYTKGDIKVNMGYPVRNATHIPSQAGQMQSLSVADRDFDYTSISMGNPHVVIELNAADTLVDFNVPWYGSKIENTTRLFPNKTNVEFIKIQDEHTVEMRVRERGTGETLACGTGACAVVVATTLHKQTPPDTPVTVQLKGGSLQIQRAGSMHDPVWMTGPAEFVFEGTFEL